MACLVGTMTGLGDGTWVNPGRLERDNWCTWSTIPFLKMTPGMYHGRPTGSSLMKPSIFRDYPTLDTLTEWAMAWRIWWFPHPEYM